MAEKVLPGITAAGVMLIVVAVAYFSLSGSGVGGHLLSGAAGSAVGGLAASALVGSPRRGRLAAVLLLALIVVGCPALVLAASGALVTAIEEHEGWVVFFCGLLGAAFGAALLRLFGWSPSGARRARRDAQASRRRS
jgi:hypothetical protein